MTHNSANTRGFKCTIKNIKYWFSLSIWINTTRLVNAGWFTVVNIWEAFNTYLIMLEYNFQINKNIFIGLEFLMNIIFWELIIFHLSCSLLQKAWFMLWLNGKFPGIYQHTTSRRTIILKICKTVILTIKIAHSHSFNDWFVFEISIMSISLFPLKKKKTIF